MYCDFYSLAGVSELQQELWVLRTVNWLETKLTFLKQKTPFWDSVFIGGGTPSLLSIKHWKILLGAIASNLQPNSEWTIEVNPESLTAEHLEVFQLYGVNRLSIGIQSFQDFVLQTSTRPTRFKDIQKTKALLKDWKGQFNLDLICGLPGQTKENQMQDLIEALQWKPDHLSWYSLMIEDDTPLFKMLENKKIKLPDFQETEDWWLDGRQLLIDSGYEHYEISNFALKNKQCQHNLKYWRMESWWAIGPAGASLIEQDGCPVRYAFTPDLASYLKGDPPVMEKLALTDWIKESLMMGLRLQEGITIQRWQRYIPYSWNELIPKTLKKWEKYLNHKEMTLSLTDEGRLLLDSFLIQAFEEIDIDGRAKLW
jgi:oxygen-independent coproporphyrinogen III oxidase